MTSVAQAKVWISIVSALALVSLFAWQQGRVVKLESEIKEVNLQHAEEKTLRTAEALAHTTKLREIEAMHAADQQTREDEHAKEKRTLEVQRATESASAGRLRQQLAAATARSREPSDADPASCERDQSRLETLGTLAGEGVELLAEGQGLVRERDLQIGRLLDQIKIDRAACQSGEPRSVALPPGP